MLKSTRYKNKWAGGIFEDWQRVRSVKFLIVEVGGVFKEYELNKFQPLTRPITEMDALTLNYWLSKFVQEVAKCSKDPYPPKTLYQIVCSIRRFAVEKESSQRVQSLGLIRQKVRELALLERETVSYFKT